jgi:hypothetical protein
MIVSLVICFGYGDFSRAHYFKQWFTNNEFNEEHVKCIMHRIPNDFRIEDSAQEAIVSSQCYLSGILTKAHETDQFIPARCSIAVHGCAFSVGTQQSIVSRRGDRCRCSK